MSIIAKWRVTHNHQSFEPGAEVVGLSKADTERLLRLDAIEITGDIHVQNEGNTDSQVDEHAAFINVLNHMKRPDLISYANKAQVPFDVKMTNPQLKEAIEKDAEEKGIDIEALPEEHLRFYAQELKIENAESMSYEDLINKVSPE